MDIRRWVIRSHALPGFCLDIGPDQPNGGAPCLILNSFDNRASQRWAIDAEKGRITVTAGKHTGKAVDIGARNGAKAGNDIILWRPGSHPNQVWQYNETMHQLISLHCGLAIDITDAKYKPETAIKAQNPTGDARQTWLIHSAWESNDPHGVGCWTVIYPPPPQDALGIATQSST
jgi:hypothetical protein